MRSSRDGLWEDTSEVPPFFELASSFSSSLPLELPPVPPSHNPACYHACIRVSFSRPRTRALQKPQGSFLHRHRIKEERGEEEKTHFLEQIPQPMQRSSEMKATLSVDRTSIHSFPILTTGQDL